MQRSVPVIYFLFIFSLLSSKIPGQDKASYLKANAIRIDNPFHLSDSVYKVLFPFQVFMVGEMHGTNECAQFVSGLVNLLISKGDSISVGLEIPEEQMELFISSRTDSSIYQSRFFCCNEHLDGRQSFAWARVISHLKNNPKAQIFFFDKNTDEGKVSERDSTMYLKIKKQIQLHPLWKVVTLSGNYHASFTTDEKKAATLIRDDMELNLSKKICTIYNQYQSGTSMGDYGKGLEEKKLERPGNYWDTTFSFDKYFVLLSPESAFPYTAVYYTKNITASRMVKGNLDLLSIKKELKAIYDRDQKTRKGSDSSAFVHYIDSSNQVQIKSLIAKYGWMGRSLIGNYNQVFFLVIQHADSTTQEKYFPLLQQSVEEGESRASDMAMMHDRILMRQGKKQIYGSQVVFGKSGEQVFYPIEDEKNVNSRRAKVGLQPMEEYAKYFGIEYKLPAQ